MFSQKNYAGILWILDDNYYFNWKALLKPSDACIFYYKDALCQSLTIRLRPLLAQNIYFVLERNHLLSSLFIGSI